MSAQVDTQTPEWTPRRIVRLARRTTLLLAGVGLIYLVTRFEFRPLPGTCSPLTAFRPGDQLLIDKRPRPLQAGDAVLLRVEGGTPAVTLVERVRPEDGALWCTTDVDDCPGIRSGERGWIPREVVAGRVLLGWGGEG